MHTCIYISRLSFVLLLFHLSMHLCTLTMCIILQRWRWNYWEIFIFFHSLTYKRQMHFWSRSNACLFHAPRPGRTFLFYPVRNKFIEILNLKKKYKTGKWRRRIERGGVVGWVEICHCVIENSNVRMYIFDRRKLNHRSLHLFHKMAWNLKKCAEL